MKTIEILAKEVVTGAAKAGAVVNDQQAKQLAAEILKEWEATARQRAVATLWECRDRLIKSM